MDKVLGIVQTAQNEMYPSAFTFEQIIGFLDPMWVRTSSEDGRYIELTLERAEGTTKVMLFPKEKV